MSLLPPQRSIRTCASVLRSVGFLLGPGRRPALLHDSASAKASEAVAADGPRPVSGAAPPSAMPSPTPVRSAPVTGQLDMLDQSHKPDFYQAVAEIMKIRQSYIEDRCVFVQGKLMVPLMLGLGAKPRDLARLQTVSDNLYSDPTLPFRRSRNGRFCIDFDSNSIRRLEFQPFTLSVEEDFKRYDSGKIRRFDEVQNNLQLNSVFQALLAFKAIIMHGVSTVHRPKLEYDNNKWVCTLFNLRTVTTKNILGEPALEGVHSDGVDHTMTTYLGSNNMASNSAATFMHDMDETTGIKLEEMSPHHLLSRVQHRHFLDTLMIVDYERKHSLSAVYPIDKSKEATRDMLIFFTRKPVSKTHVSGSIDSLRPHRDLPMEVPIFVPGAR